MKAILCKAYGLPSSLVLEDIESPKPKEKEVLVSLKACGVNFPDTLISVCPFSRKKEYY